jgi:ABC-2 type transport system permease protein
MSTTTPGLSAVPGGTPAAAMRRIPFSTLLRVELRKAYDTRAGLWLLIAIGGLVLVAELIAALARGFHDRNQGLFASYMSWTDFATVAGIITGLLLPVLAILLVTSEWTQRTGMVTFALEPRRSLIVYAKMLIGVALTVATVVFALVMGLVFNALYAAISGHGDWSLDGKGFLGFFITQNLAMLTGFALAALFLNSAAGIVVYVVFRFVVTGLIAVGENLMGWFNHVGPWIDFQNAQGPLFDWTFTGKEWAELFVSGMIWLGLPLAIGLRRIMRAEVK